MDRSRTSPHEQGRRVVLGFDAGCVACNDLAGRIEQAAGGKLEVLSLHHPQVAHWRGQALGQDAPWAPTLIEVDGTNVRAWTGLRMGARLSRLLGPVATWRVMQVLGDGPARSTRASDGAEAAGVSRRQFLKGLAGGLTALSILPATEALAAGRKGFQASSVSRVGASSATVGRLKRFEAVKTAGGRFGSPDWNNVTKALSKSRDGGERTVYSIPYVSATAVASKTFLVTEDEDSRADAGSIVVRVRQTGENQGKLDYFLVDGSHLGNLEVSDGKVRAQQAEDRLGASSGDERRRPGFRRCFINCVANRTDIGCALDCFGCLTGGGIDCVACGFCAGSVALECRRFCN